MGETGKHTPERKDPSAGEKNIVNCETQRILSICRDRDTEAEVSMAVNPPLLSSIGGMPVPFEAEMFLLTRQSVEFEVDKIPE